MATFNESAYEEALDTLAAQLFAMASEDVDRDDYDTDAEYQSELNDVVDNYSGAAVEQLGDKLQALCPPPNWDDEPDVDELQEHEDFEQADEYFGGGCEHL